MRAAVIDRRTTETQIALTLRLDERLYGGRTATMDDYQACRGAHEQIERLLCAPA